MKVSSWQNVIISWANALRLLDEPIKDVLDLVKGSFFVQLLDGIKEIDQDGKPDVSEADVYNVIEDFLKEEFCGFKLLGYWDSDEVTLVSSVILLWSSLESQSCRTPLFVLEDALQIKIQAFIQRFIETPLHLINRQLVMDAVLDISSDAESDEENASFVSSPRTSSTPKRSTRSSLNSSGYSPAFLALAEMKSLRNKVDLLNCEKQHLQEELEVTKSQLTLTKSKLEQKENELMKLGNQIANDECEKDQGRDEQRSESSAYFSKNSSCESSLLKMEIEDLRDVAIKLREDLESTVEENNKLVKELNNEKLLRSAAESKCIELENRNSVLITKEEELESMVANLRKTCEEQSYFLAEKCTAVDEESLSRSLSEFETLGSVMDIKYSELKEDLRVQSDLLEEKSKEVKDLLEAKETADKEISTLKTEIERLKSELSTNEKGELSECHLLRNEIKSLQESISIKNKACDQLKLQLDLQKQKLKALNGCSQVDEKRFEKIIDKHKKMLDDYNIKFEEVKDEIISLKCQLYEKSVAIECFKEENNYLHNCLANKATELSNLESDYNNLNLTKDQEIMHLMKSVEYLNKEVKLLQEQLIGECSKNEKLCHSANEWRQMLSKGLVTANEEIAQELIALHESLQWKTLRISELSLQIDQFKSEISDKETLNKELQDRVCVLTEKNKDILKELHTSKNLLANMNARIVSLEMNENRLKHEVSKKNQRFEMADFELKELWKLLRQKFHTIDIEMNTGMLREKIELEDIVKYIDFMTEKLKESSKTINHLNMVINELETEVSEKVVELEKYAVNLQAVSEKAPNTVQNWVYETSFFQDRLKKIEQDFENNTIKLRDNERKLNEATDAIQTKNRRIADLEQNLNELEKELKDKVFLIECLQQNVNLYEHEKSILEKKLSSFSAQSDRRESFFQGDGASKHEEETGSLKSLGSINDEKLTKSFQEKLTDLQTKLKAQHEEEIKQMVEDYSKKIDQLKNKVKKDCVHIEHLSSELWETSDRLLLAQQEADALRSQLRRTRSLLSERCNTGTEDCHSFKWLGGADGADFLDDFMMAISMRRTQSGRLPLGAEGQAGYFETDEEMFNQQYLEDMKAGICRLPSPIGRLSCPAESTRLENDASEDVFLVPKDKPRKAKGSITYRKPGPPTPSISAARHSLPGNELRKGLREQNTNVSSGRSRLSQLFGSINLSKPKNVQESPTPKTKRKGFFQRTFKNRENLPPK